MEIYVASPRARWRSLQVFVAPPCTTRQASGLPVVAEAAGVAVSFFFSSRRRHTRSLRDWSSDVCSSDLALHERYVHAVPFFVWAAMIAGIITLLNLRGIRSSAVANKALLAVMSAVVLLFIALAVRFLLSAWGVSGLFSVRPFYDLWLLVS